MVQISQISVFTKQYQEDFSSQLSEATGYHVFFLLLFLFLAVKNEFYKQLLLPATPPYKQTNTENPLYNAAMS